MNLIVVIVALFGERFIGSLQEYRRLDWYVSYADWMQKQARFMQGTLGVVLSAGSLTVVVALVEHQFKDGFNPLQLIFSIFILLYCLGPHTFYDQVKAFIDSCSARNFESASWYARDILERKLTEDELKHLPGAVFQALFVTTNQRLMAVIFWFVLLGPVGAVFYRGVQIIASNANMKDELSNFDSAAQRVAYLLNWPTARLVALSYAIMGNFVEGAAQIKKRNIVDDSNWPNANEHLLVCAGMGSLSFRHKEISDITHNDIANALALVRRSVAFWVGVIALMTLAGWLG